MVQGLVVRLEGLVLDPDTEQMVVIQDHGLDEEDMADFIDFCYELGVELSDFIYILWMNLPDDYVIITSNSSGPLC